MRKSKTKSLSKKKADRYYSEYIRKKWADSSGRCKCVTCGKKLPWKKIHCGHFMSRRKLPTRYDERNTAPQCAGCNTFKQGQQFKFGKWIDRTYGEGTADELLRKSNSLQKFTQMDYEEVAKEYKEMLEEL